MTNLCEKGVWLLEKARQLRPRIIRILATAFSDMDAAVAAVNSGAIYKYVNKPWDPPQLEATLKRGLEFFIVQRERDQLLKEKMSVLHNMMIADRIVSLGLLAAGLSHHIRNSLVAVKTFLDLAPAKLREENLDLSGLRNPDFWRDYYQNVQSQIEKINNMLKDLWAASETPAFSFKDEVSARAVVDSVIKKLKESFAAKNVSIRNEIPESLPALRVDKPKFDRLFELLLKDELVSLPAGSEIVLSGSPVVAAGPNEPEVEILVRDNGPDCKLATLASHFNARIKPRSTGTVSCGTATDTFMQVVSAKTQAVVKERAPCLRFVSSRTPIILHRAKRTSNSCKRSCSTRRSGRSC